MKRFLVGLALLAPAFLTSTRGEAADHYDMVLNLEKQLPGDQARHHDIIDLFAFTSPDKSGKLVMVMNTHANASRSSVFSDVIRYSFRLRTGMIREEGNEYRITCVFGTLDQDSRQHGSCAAYRVKDGIATAISGGSTTVTVGATEAGPNPNLRAFAGPRADAFFGDGIGLITMVKTHSLPFQVTPIVPDKIRNPTQTQDTLSIVLELDTKKVLGEPASIFRIAAETAKKKVR